MIDSSNPHTRYSDEWYVYNQLRHLQRIAKEGLHTVYKNLREFWYDFYPDFSWNTERMQKQIEQLTTHPEFAQLEIDFAARFQVSLREKLTRQQDED